MPPVGNITCLPHNMTTVDSSNIGKDDLNALLYIVVTLLFYSMGIIIGIITYLKREQAEMEEDKMFDMYMQIKREPFNLYKRERVQQMALYLKQIEEQQAAREKIENWRTLEHMQRFQPCRRHGFRHASCPDCSKAASIPEICHGYDEATALAMADGNWPEAGGGTALLCSLTLGVCEPLLTPESIKRVAFPDSPHSDGKPFSSAIAGASMLRAYPCMPTKSSFRHGSFTVHYTDTTVPQLKESRPISNSGNECIQINMNDLSPETHFDSPTMFDRGDIELKELRQFKYEEVKAVFQKTEVGEGQSACEDEFVDPQIIPSFSKRSVSPTTTSDACAMLLRQLNCDPECRLSELSVHANLRDRDVVDTRTNIDQEFAIVADQLGEGVQLLPQQTADQTDVTDSKPETKNQVEMLNKTEELIASAQQTEEINPEPGYNRRPIDIDVCGDVKQPYVEQQQQDKELTQPHSQQVRQDIQQAVAPIIIPTTISWHTPQKCELPLHLFVLTQQQVHSGQVRPQVFVPVPNIPQSISKDGTATICAGSPNSILPQATPAVHSPLYGAWKKPNSKTVDISDVARARQLGLNWKSKTVDKKNPPRSQPERRGALFFTQRSLQKDSDSSKALSSRKPSRPSALSRQESLDSHTSRSSEMSENIDSPLIQPSCGLESGIALSSPSTSISSNLTSPLEMAKQAKRLASLAGSNTLETSKLLQE